MTTPTTQPEEFNGRLSKGKDWREIVAWVGDLPPMPQVASRAISMVENPETTANELTEQLFNFATMSLRERIALRNRAEEMSAMFDWEKLGSYYDETYKIVCGA